MFRRPAFLYHQAVLRRTAEARKSTSRSFGRLTLDPGRRTAFLDEKPLPLTTNEFAALSLFTRNAGRVLDRDQILQELRGIDSEAFKPFGGHNDQPSAAEAWR